MILEPSSIPIKMSQPLRPAGRPFLELPPEIRNNIYELLFQSPQERDSRQLQRPVRGLYQVQPGISLLRTCRQVHHEAAGVLYACSELVFSAHMRTQYMFPSQYLVTEISDWFQSIGQHIELVKKLIIDCTSL